MIITQSVYHSGNQTPYNATMTVKVATGAFLISMIVLVNGYVSVLASILTVPKLEPIINNLDELAASSVFRLTLEKGSLVADMIMASLLLFFFPSFNALSSFTFVHRMPLMA